MASIDKINVKGEEYVINEDKWADNDNKWDSLDHTFKTVTKTVGPASASSGRSIYVDTDEIDGFTPICAIYDRGNTDPNCIPSGIDYTPGSKPYIRIINTAADTKQVNGTAIFVFIKSSILSS